MMQDFTEFTIEKNDTEWRFLAMLCANQDGSTSIYLRSFEDEFCNKPWPLWDEDYVQEAADYLISEYHYPLLEGKKINWFLSEKGEPEKPILNQVSL